MGERGEEEEDEPSLSSFAGNDSVESVDQGQREKSWWYPQPQRLHTSMVSIVVPF